MKSGSAGIKGTQYEIRLSLLCCLDAVRNKRKFRLASNMSEARKWDDVVFQVITVLVQCGQDER